MKSNDFPSIISGISGHSHKTRHSESFAYGTLFLVKQDNMYLFRINSSGAFSAYSFCVFGICRPHIIRNFVCNA